MLEHFFKSQSMQAVREGRHGPLLEGFARELCQAGYGDVTVRRRFRAAKHLVHWMERKRVPVSDLTEDVLKRFGQHRCRCAGFGPTPPIGLVRRRAIVFEVSAQHGFHLH